MAQLNNLVVTGASRFLQDINGNITGNAGTATILQTSRNIFGKSFNGSADVAGQALVYGSYNSTASTRYSTGGIQVRENGLVGNAQSDISYAPAIGFHWGGRIAASFLFHSDGNFYLRKQNFTDRATLDANLNGNATSATSATSATTATTARKIINDTIRMTSPNTAYYDGGLRYYLASSSMTTDKPPLGDGKILDMQWDNNGGWATQLYITHSNTNTATATRAMLRSQNGTTWKSWIPVAVFNQTTPTTGQVVVTDGTDGGVKSSGYTIATSVPSDAVFTDHTYNFSGSTFYSGKNDTAEHNADNATYNGHYYYNSNGPSTTALGAQSTDGALYVQAYSTAWVGQIAQDYRDGSLFVRGKNNGTWQRWLAVLDSGNIGYETTATVLYDPHTRKFTTVKSTSAWDAQAYSKQGYTDNVFVTFKPNQTNMALMVGLDTNPSQDASYGNIDYCWYVHNDAKLTIFESGTEYLSSSGHTTYVAGDELKVEYAGGYIRYYHNGVLCRETARAISGKLYMDSTFHGASSCIYDVKFEPAGTTATYVPWGGVTGKPSTYTPSAHNHGTLHSDFTVSIANTTEDSGWSMINSTYNGYLLKSIRFQGSSPAWGVGNYGAGICFGGGDTKGILSCAYGSPLVKIAGGNGTKPVWWIGLTGTTGTSYNLANFLTAHQTVTDNNPTLAWSTKSKVATIGGTAINVTMPANPNTWRGIQDNLTSSTNTTESLSAKQGYLLANGSARDDTKLPLAGGTMTGQILTSFKSSVATGSYAPTATTVPDLVTELRYSSGCMGSFSLNTAYTLSGSGITIPTRWYNFIWVPHRSGGINGAASGDNCNYGSLYLSGMTNSGCYMIRFAGSNISEVRDLYKDTNTTYALSVSGNNLVLSASGTAQDTITAPYATTASKLSNTAKVGDTNKPVYFTANGVPEAISYTIGKSVPSTAVFTDTTYTLSADTTNNKIKLTPSSGTAQSITVPYAENAGWAQKILDEGGVNNQIGTENVPVYVNASSLVKACGFHVFTGTVAANSQVDLNLKFGLVIFGRISTSATPSMAFIDQWGGKKDYYTNTTHVISIVTSGTTVRVKNNGSTIANYVAIGSTVT